MRAQAIWAVLILVIIVASALTYAFVFYQPPTPAKRVPVGTVLYLWYGFNETSMKWTGGLGTSHWNDSASGIVKDKPFLGYYASDNNNTLAWQLSEMKDAGISWILVSWWGTGNKTQSKSNWELDSAINNATLNLFEYLAANRAVFPFKVAIMVENFNGTKESPYDLTPSDYSHIYTYIYTQFYRPFNSSVFYWEGKPLITSFNGWMERLPQNDTFTYRMVGSPPNNFDWNFWQGDGYLTASVGTQPWNYEHSPEISTDGEVGLIWRYDDYYLRPNSYMRLDPNGTLGLYGYEWNYVIGKASSVKLVLFYSWNEYHERSELEPHWDFTTGGNVNMTGVTSSYVQALEKSATTCNFDSQSCLSLVLYSVAIVAVVGVILALVVISRKRHLESAKDGGNHQAIGEGKAKGEAELTKARRETQVDSRQYDGDIKSLAKVGQGISAFIGSIALVLLILEWVLSSALTPSELGLPDYWVLLTILVVTALLVIRLYQKFRVSTPAWIGGGVGTGLAILAIIVITIIAFLGYVATGPP